MPEKELNHKEEQQKEQPKDVLEEFFKPEKEADEERVESFRRKLKMGRISKPIYFVFNGNEEYPEEKFRKNMAKTRGKDKKIEVDDWGGSEASYRRANSEYEIHSEEIYSKFAHEFLHHLSTVFPGFNEYILTNAVQWYMDLCGEFLDKEKMEPHMNAVKSPAEIMAEFNSGHPLSEIQNSKNMRPLNAWEKFYPKTEQSHGFDNLGFKVGNRAANIEAATKKTGAGLYYLKLISDGMSPEEAEKNVMGEYPPLEEFEKKYGKSWERILKNPEG